ncbi:MAG TPA: hypothetical protein VGU43_00285 [Thermoplasmata archaeon]|nr:hypothetical protein [Thermoplasmata archaeon]
MGSESKDHRSPPSWPASVGRYLSRRIRPRLASEGERALAESVKRAVEARDLGRLSALSPREKRLVLGAIDRELEGGGGPRPNPRVVVELTGLFGPELLGDGSSERRPAAPSR